MHVTIYLSCPMTCQRRLAGLTFTRSNFMGLSIGFALPGLKRKSCVIFIVPMVLHGLVIAAVFFSINMQSAPSACMTPASCVINYPQSCAAYLSARLGRGCARRIGQAIASCPRSWPLPFVSGQCHRRSRRFPCRRQALRRWV